MEHLSTHKKHHTSRCIKVQMVNYNYRLNKLCTHNTENEPFSPVQKSDFSKNNKSEYNQY